MIAHLSKTHAVTIVILIITGAAILSINGHLSTPIIIRFKNFSGCLFSGQIQNCSHTFTNGRSRIFQCVEGIFR